MDASFQLGNLPKEGEELYDLKNDVNKAAVVHAVQEEHRKAHTPWAG